MSGGVAGEEGRGGYSPEMTGVARRLRRESTPAEQRVWEAVRGRRCGGHRFLRQAPAGQYVLDFFCAAARLAVEVDGAVHDEPDVREQDARRQYVLEEELKMSVLRLRNEEVLGLDLPHLRARILDAVDAALAVAPPPPERPARRR